MEIISSSIAVLVWEYALKPIADSIKKEYGDESKKLLKSLVSNVLSNEKIEPKELEIIEAEILNAPADILSDREKFLEYIEGNKNIPNVIQTHYGSGDNVAGNKIIYNK